MNRNNMQADVTSEQVPSGVTEVKTDSEFILEESKQTPEMLPKRISETDGVSYVSALDVLQAAADRLYDLELARISERNAVLQMWRRVDHPDHIPKKLQQQISLLLHL